MLRKIIAILRKSKKYNGTYAEKISVLFILTRFQIKHYFFKKKNAIVRDHFFKYRIAAYDHFTINFLFNEVFISNEYYFQSSNSQPLIIDCGGNIGMSVLYFKKLYPASRIIAFEANPHVFSLLADNVKSNKLENVELHNIALYDRDRELSFYIGDSIGTLVGSVVKERGGANEIMVKAQKLSHYLGRLETVDLLKIDVEGAEINIMNDLFESGMMHKVKECIVEYHHNMEGQQASLAAFLSKPESFGFKYSIKADHEKKNEFQNILVHFYRE